MKISFDIKFRSQIESGEYHVETNAGCPVRIVCWDMACELPILGLVLLNNEKTEEIAVGFTNEGSNLLGEPLYDKLFIITPEEELSEFEKELESFYNHHLQVCTYDNQGTVEDSLHDGATKLLALAIDARAREMDEALEKSKLDKDSIPYHLIEFMCNLYTCQNWKEIEETAEMYVTRLKAAAMKDLPRWRKNKSFETRSLSMYVKDREYFVVKDGYSISITELIKKLPGFNK